ncbi:DUF4864 domain-containing protein [Waterburya agarophytonicola K14]|uniref:DUF4864 domain-containing protein n=1 Tax=Waterburya agarophytonicola KI4 TaxID=2874699 RepID=A0A964FHC4_9CYAN|nr:DUF4864 domain-containing protein [Waterburya agarophytonicola]MCC0177509.1 DUF4864 domain-containing protein [Waterburya agarophytonicola KI4]
MYISENDKVIIRQLVEKQLHAFQQNDEATAFALMSPSIQEKISQRDLIKKIRSKYSAIVRPRSIMFQGFTLVDNYPALVSMVMDRKGELAQAVFVVQHQPDYSWRIHGYELLSIDKKIV